MMMIKDMLMMMMIYELGDNNRYEDDDVNDDAYYDDGYDDDGCGDVDDDDFF